MAPVLKTLCFQRVMQALQLAVQSPDHFKGFKHCKNLKVRLSAMNKPIEIMTIDEVAAMLRVSKRAVYAMTSQRGRSQMKHPLPVLRINSSVRFIKSDIEEWVEKLRGKVS